MSEDDFIERTRKHWANRGLDYSADALVNNFALYGREKRASSLDQIDAELSNGGEISSSEGAMRRAADLALLRSELGEIHQRLIRVNR